MPAHAARTRSLLPHALAVLYGIALAYVSLEPFAPWLRPEPGTPFFLFAPWPAHWTRPDAIFNVIAYVPLGVFVAWASAAAWRHERLTTTLMLGAALSFALETAQMFLPLRDASTLDLIANVTGTGLGALLAAGLGHSRLPAWLTGWRDRWVLPGSLGDLGLALLVIWLVAHVNPGIALFGTTYELDLQLAGDPPVKDLAVTLVTGATSAFQLLGVGLFVALLVPQRRQVGIALLALIGLAIGVKVLGGAVLLKPAAWDHWLSPAVADGVAAGALLLLAAVWLPRAAQVALAAVALLSSVLAPLLIPDLLFARAPLSGFAWSYGQLLNFNGLTRAVLVAWPGAASMLLFALAGRPRWGAAES